MANAAAKQRKAFQKQYFAIDLMKR